MIVIELWGSSITENTVLQVKIEAAFDGKPWQDEYVVMSIHSSVLGHNTKITSFIRLFSTPHKHLDDVIFILKKLGVNLQIAELVAFHPKKA